MPFVVRQQIACQPLGYEGLHLQQYKNAGILWSTW